MEDNLIKHVASCGSGLWDWIPKIYICSTMNPKKPNALNELHKRLLQMGIDPNNTKQVFINLPPRGHYKNDKTLSCTANHLECYRKFYMETTDEDGPFALFLEDDVFFRRGVDFEKGLQVLKEFVISRPLHSWDVVFPGHFPLMASSMAFQKDEFEIHESISWCTHALFISRPCIQKLMTFTPDTLGVLATEQGYRPMVQHCFLGNLLRSMLLGNASIDSYYANAMLTGDLKTFALYPQIIYQDSQGPKWIWLAETAEWWCEYFGSWMLPAFSIIILILLFLYMIFIYTFLRIQKNNETRLKDMGDDAK